MDQSGLLVRISWLRLTVNIARAVVAAVGLLALVSYGGQLIATPALLPIQWSFARHSEGWVSKLFSLSGSALLFEAVWLATLVTVGESAIAIVGGVVMGVAGAVVFFRSSRPRE